jgi:hypothetical protein
MTDRARRIDEPVSAAAVAELRPPLHACTRDRVALRNSHPLTLVTQLRDLFIGGHGQAADRRLRGGWLLRAAGCVWLLLSPLLLAPISAAMRSRLIHSQIRLLDICSLS